MSWSLKFDEPIPLANGKLLRSLRDAANHVMALPKQEAALPHWQLAVECLLSAAEQGGLVMMARIAMVRALDGGEAEIATAPRRKFARKYRIVN